MTNRREFFTKLFGTVVGGVVVLSLPKTLLAESKVGKFQRGFVYAPYIPLDRHRVLVEQVKKDIVAVFQKYVFEPNCATIRQCMLNDLQEMHRIPCDWGTIPPKVGFTCNVYGPEENIVINAIIRKGNTDEFTYLEAILGRGNKNI